MKPENLKAINKYKGEARVKTLIRAHLYWLSGFPYLREGNVYWCCPYLPDLDKQKITITAKMISKAHRIINELRRDYPAALPRVIGDSTEWERRCKTYLGLTKALIANSDKAEIESLFELDDSFHAKLSKRFNQNVLNSELGRAVSWMHFINRTPLTASLEFIFELINNLPSQHRPDIVLASKLCHIYVLDGAKALAYLRLHFNPHGVSTVTKDGPAYITPFIQYRYKPKKKKLFSFPIKPEDNTSQLILKSVDWLLALNSNRRKRALLLFENIELDKTISKYLLWWQGVDQLTGKISNLINYPNINKSAFLAELQDALESYRTRFPGSFDISGIFSIIQEFSQSPDISGSINQFFRSYSKLEKNKYLNVLFLFHFKQCFRESEKSEKYFSHYVSCLAKYLDSAKNTAALEPWSDLESSYWLSSESYIFENLNMSNFSDFFDLLLRIYLKDSGKVSKDWMRGISLIVAANFSIDKAYELTTYLIQVEKIDEVSRITLKIAKEQKLSLGKVSKLIDIWNKLDEEYTDDDTLEVIYETFISIGASELFINLVFSEHISLLRRCSNQIRIIKKIHGFTQVPCFPLDLAGDLTLDIEDSWLNQYPEEFHSNLTLLNHLSGSAEKKARKIFLSTWWPREFIKSELKKLKSHSQSYSQHANSTIQNRILSLENKLKSHKTASCAMKEKIQGKLIERIKKEQFRSWRSELDHQFKISWNKFLDADNEQLPDWLFCEEMIHYLLPIMDFNAGSKTLAKYVIKHRATTTDWQFTTHPKNETFLRNLEQEGFNRGAWLCGIGPKNYQSKSSNQICIDVVEDPLEILNMGGHFKTCLSPGSFNYFSVFANIADINKRVIYGKNTDGKVIGRVLVGLLPSGGMTVFNIYCHHSDDEFHTKVMEYIQSWAEFAGFTLTDQGYIPKLVAAEWYDDGAIDVGNNIKCLKDGSEFRRQLAQMNESTFENELTEALSPLPINELTYPLIINLPEVKKCPQLIPALIKIARKITRLSEHDKIKLFYMADDNNAGEQFYQAFRRDLMCGLMASIRREKWFNPELGYRVASYNPSDALKVVKKLGNTWTGNWRNNLYPATARVAVKSLNKLGREHQARQIAEQYKIENCS
ncbi:hypothetical protein [Aliikangiella coralliicola]|uniref:Uncharacterized protein n=1 Tax=Aliikangiella coralliicola TaxID=2592383 RepID=A0A545TV33_9GAMM|nr:hypothetical protein [Aliikangiella coralliicola]TQV81074.1 hypothetical protein FLL46_26040 [Aliikangiella coralliicola]